MMTDDNFEPPASLEAGSSFCLHSKRSWPDPSDRQSHSRTCSFGNLQHRQQALARSNEGCTPILWRYDGGNREMSEGIKNIW
jgi:hypothetical protein